MKFKTLDELRGGRGLSRRSFLGMAGAAPLALAIGQRQQGGGRRIPIALQLYSVRDDCKADFDACLARVAEMGFEGVEFAGYYGYAGRAAELRSRLDSLKLKAAGTHIGVETLEGDALQKTIDFHQTIGCRFLVVPSAKAFTDPDQSKVLAETFNRVTEKLAPLDMACGYHNHTAEFKKDGDQTYWDLFAARTRQEVILQQDCGWTMAAGHDPAAYIRKYPGRSRTVHFKPTVREGETGKKPILGQDSVDWRAVYEACRTVGGTEWVVLEQERYPDGRTPFESVADSLTGLRAVVG